MNDHDHDHDLRLIKSELTNVMPREAIDGWLATPQPVFDHRTPAGVIAAGEATMLWRVICGPAVAA